MLSHKSRNTFFSSWLDTSPQEKQMNRNMIYFLMLHNNNADREHEEIMSSFPLQEIIARKVPCHNIFGPGGDPASEKRGFIADPTLALIYSHFLFC